MFLEIVDDGLAPVPHPPNDSMRGRKREGENALDGAVVDIGANFPHLDGRGAKNKVFSITSAKKITKMTKERNKKGTSDEEEI